MRPRFSVLIDTYNHGRFIEQAVVSAVEQDFPAADFEILVVDDGSTDDTPEVVKKFAPRVKLLQKKNGGQASAFNAGFAEAQGEIIALLDGDDWWLQGKLAAVANAFTEHPEVAAVGHGYYRCFEKSGTREIVARSKPIFFDLSTPEAARASCIGCDFFLPTSLSVRKEVFDRVKPIPEVLTICADAPIAAAAMAMRTLVMPDCLSCYRVHATNLYGLATNDTVRMRRRHEIDENVYNVLRPLLLKWGIASECVDALLDPLWIRSSRFRLQTYGGSHLNTFRTEMRFFKYEARRPGAGYLFFKYLVMGPATLLLPPQRFYAARDWYYKKNFGRLRSRIFGT